MPHATVIPRLRHTGFYFSPSDKLDGPVTADWSMRYVLRRPEKLICKLETDWDAEVARSVKNHRDCMRMVRLDDFLHLA